jgi:hypothetical protein
MRRISRQAFAAAWVSGVVVGREDLDDQRVEVRSAG